MELCTFSVETCYVYVNIPPSDAAGYRANAWDVEQWTQEVRLKVITKEDDLRVQLFDRESGHLFAECPVPNDVPVQISVEPVLDSSRYYVIKVIDATSNKHAFIGIGFGERGQSSDFLSAINDHRHYLEKKATAEKMKKAYTANEGDNKIDYSLKPGETITVRLPSVASPKERPVRTYSSELPPPPSADDDWKVPAKLLKGQIQGVLSVFTHELQWQPHDPTQATPIDLATDAITGWKRAKGKPILRIATETAAHLFEFEDVSVRESVEKTLQPLLSAGEMPISVPDPYAAIKQQLLQEDRDLRAVYNNSVSNGVILEDAFWKSRLTLLEEHLHKGMQTQPIGLSSALMPDLLEGQEGRDTVQLTPERIQQIFAERPSVKAAFDRHVPADMDEQEFWSKYCTHQEAIKKKRRKIVTGDVQGAHEIDDEFADLFNVQWSREQRPAVHREASAFFDLVLDDRYKVQGYGTRTANIEYPRKEGTRTRLFAVSDIASESNQHGAVVLKGLSHVSHDVQSHFHLSQDESGMDTGLLDHLKEERAETHVTLSIQKPARKPHIPLQTTEWTAVPSIPMLSPEVILDVTSMAALSGPSFKVLKELHHGGDGREEETVRGTSPIDCLSIVVLDEMRRRTLIVNELLRHFWSSYPVDSHSKATSVTKLKDAFVAQFEQMKSVRSKAQSSQQSALIQQLLKPVQAQIHAAVDKYTTELESRQRHQRHI